jgi:hypothetical protein
MEILSLLTEPAAWAALLTLILLEVVLGIDNLVFIAILLEQAAPEQQKKARRIGLFLPLHNSPTPLHVLNIPYSLTQISPLHNIFTPSAPS